MNAIDSAIDSLNKNVLPEDPFEGPFSQLLTVLPERPGYVASPKGTIVRLIDALGIDPEQTAAIQELYGNPTLVAYRAFSDFHGTSIADNDLMTDYLRPALEGHGADKQNALLIGPPGAGKSAKVDRIKDIWRSGEPLPALADCPIHDNPLNLLFMVPRVAVHASQGRISRAVPHAAATIKSLRLLELLDWNNTRCKEIVASKGIELTNENLARLALRDVDAFVSLCVYGLGLPKATRNTIGMPCPFCQERVFGQFEYKGNACDIADFQMGAMIPALGHGLVDVPEVDAINFNLAEFIGRRNIAEIVRARSADPRSVELNGYYCRANRGILVLTEILKNPGPAQRINLEATQSRRIPIPQPLAPFHENGLHIEICAIGHSNEQEYIDFLADRKNEPYWDRFHRILVPYPLEYKSAALVTRKLWQTSNYSNTVEEGGVHVEPILFDLEAQLRVLASLESDPQVPLMAKMQVYNGERARLPGMTIIDVVDLRHRASSREGMEGISPRQTSEAVLGALAARSLVLTEMGKMEAPCITSKDFISEMFVYLKKNVSNKPRRELLMGFLSAELSKWRRKALSKYVKASFLEAFATECQETFNKYVEWSNASVLGRAPQSAGSSNTRISPQERDAWLRKIETTPLININDGQKERFRHEVQAAVAQYRKKHGNGEVPYDVHQGLKEVIEAFVLVAVSDIVKMLSESTSHTPEQEKKFASARQRLISEHGFCVHCANQLFDEVSTTNNFIID